MNLVIVESPTKAKTLRQFLGSDYQIEATMGHIRDLPEKKLGVKIVSLKKADNQGTSYNFIPEYVLVSKKKETIDHLRLQAKKAEKIILATDPDREGEAIAWHTAYLLTNSQSFLSDNKEQIYERIVFHEITRQAILEALANPRKIDLNLVDAQQARRVLDRLVGYKLSPLLWQKVRKGLSAGRVQSVAVKLIVEREKEIEAFIPQEYWKIQAQLQKISSPQVFTAELLEKNGKKVEIKNKQEADKILTELEKCDFQVKDVKTGDLLKYPFPPFTTSTMQQAAANLFGWSAKRTMQVAQSLYEKGLITYHRTDSVNLAKQAVFSCRKFIEERYGREYLPSIPKIYKTKSRVAQEAHEAIRPTNIKFEIQDSKIEVLGRDEKRLYQLIWKRFIACQMREAVFEETKIEIEAKNRPENKEEIKNDEFGTTGGGQNSSVYLFHTSGKKLKFAGWRKVYEDKILEKEETEKEDKEEEALPLLEKGEALKLLKLFPSQHFTQPPARYNEASLIRALEEKGIGRPSTYAPIISTIQERQYIEKQEGRFYPTVLGRIVNDFLVANFSEIVDVGFTAKMEDDLDEIANGRVNWQKVLDEFYVPFEKNLARVFEKSERVKIPVEQTEEKCEQCGAPMVIRLGKFGKFLACSRFPECKFTKPYLAKTGLTCPLCGGEIIIKKTKKGKSFYGCINYPTCNFAAWKKEEIK